MDMLTIGVFLIPFVILLVLVLYLYNVVQQNANFTFSLMQLVQRTFREYYKGQDIEPKIIGNAIDLKWKGDVQGTFDEENNNGFIVIYTNDSGINSPINSIEEANIIAGKITHVVYEYIKERDEEL